MRFGISILLGKTKVDDIDLIASLSDSHQEVVWLDISMDEVSGVYIFDTRDLQEHKREYMSTLRNGLHSIQDSPSDLPRGAPSSD